MKRLSASLLSAILILGFVACSRGEDDLRTFAEGAARGEDRKEEAVPVEVVALERGTIESALRFSATLEAERDVQVLAEAQRRVVELQVEEGDAVRTGSLLVRLQDDAQRSALNKAEIELRQATREYDRQKSLFEQNLVSEQVYNDAALVFDQAGIAVEDARRNLAYTEVRAPFSGIVTERMVNVGDHVTLNQPLFRIVDFDSIVARIYVPEKELPALATGLETRLTAEAIGGVSFFGTVDRISPVVDPGTGTVKVTVATPRQEGLRPGMYVEVELVTAVHEDALLLPKRSVVYDNDQLFVFRLGDERRVERIKVEPVLEDIENIEPAGGFSTGDLVVVAGQASLKDNALVRLPGDPDREDEEKADEVGDSGEEAGTEADA
ncbi:MAG: efflux RND transporter periplasmic adaptor subunit [Thermoanaerobaculales bacterium]|jgi:membrane fusion protein (multidrug efflux system)|nr:efflux RND transporter periplasmic adaptor subunit [Thermoanaerobaculales bacterium]